MKKREKMEKIDENRWWHLETLWGGPRGVWWPGEGGDRLWRRGKEQGQRGALRNIPLSSCPLPTPRALIWGFFRLWEVWDRLAWLGEGSSG